MKRKRGKDNWIMIISALLIGMAIGIGVYGFIDAEEVSVETCSDLLADEVFEGQEFECNVIESAEESNDTAFLGPSVNVGKRCRLHISKGVKLTCEF